MRLPPGSVVVSPHLDDAVLSCGDLIAATTGTVVVTVFAGSPPPNIALPRWDADCGFEDADQAMAARRREDDQALAAIGGRPWRLPFVDVQYGPPHPDAEIAAALQRTFVAAAAIVVPLGLFHPDHVQTSRAALLAARCVPACPTYLYADVPYRAMDAGMLEERLDHLRRAGHEVVGPLRSDGDGGGGAGAAKCGAIAAYRSQIRGLHADPRLGTADAYRPEAYWALRGRGSAGLP